MGFKHQTAIACRNPAALAQTTMEYLHQLFSAEPLPALFATIAIGCPVSMLKVGMSARVSLANLTEVEHAASGTFTRKGLVEYRDDFESARCP